VRAQEEQSFGDKNSLNRIPYVSWRQQASRSSGRRHASRCVVGMEALVGS